MLADAREPCRGETFLCSPISKFCRLVSSSTFGTFFPLTCHLCFVMVLDKAWCHGAVNPVRLRQLTNSVRTVGRSGLPVVCAQSWWVEPMLSSQRLQKVGLNCLSGNRIRDDSSARLAQHGFPQWDVHNWDRNNMIPVVPHKAVAEVSKIGNL